MRHISIIICLFTLLSCKTNSHVEEKEQDDQQFIIAENRTGAEVRAVLGSIDTLPQLKFMVNDKMIPQPKMESVRDTMDMRRYYMEIDRKSGVVKFVRKGR